MGSSARARGLAVGFATVFAAGVGAYAAWQVGYWASLLICVLAAAWAIGHTLLLTYGGGARRPEQAYSASALLQREREARALGAFLDHAPVPLLAFRAPGSLSALNLSARRFFSTDDLVSDPPEALLAAVMGAAPGQRQTLMLDVEGAPRAYALTVSELVIDSSFVRVVALVDIQAEVQAAEAAALKELILVLSHEIMNSLTPVTSLAQTAAELLRAPDGPESLALAQEATESVARRSEGLLRFVDAYRALARLPEPRFVEVGVSALLEDVALLFRSRWAERGVVLDYQPLRPDASLPLDRDLIAQALLNVLTNAAEAALEASDAPRVTLRAERAPQGRLSLCVSDNGAGVKLPDPSVIFRPFFTTKAAGTGVGLSLARQVVLAHGGDIGVGQASGGGAAVTITF
jgi:signal transduction histidine kinase